jgi:hypothetical protein
MSEQDTAPDTDLQAETERQPAARNRRDERGRFEERIFRQPGRAVEECGDPGLHALLAVPDSLESIASDRSFAAQHPFTSDRAPHQPFELLARPARELIDYLQNSDRLYRGRAGSYETVN